MRINPLNKECLDSDTGEDSAEEVRKVQIPDFSHWKNRDAFEAAFARMEKGLRNQHRQKINVEPDVIGFDFKACNAP